MGGDQRAITLAVPARIFVPPMSKTIFIDRHYLTLLGKRGCLQNSTASFPGKLFLHPLGKENFDKRLIRHISIIRDVPHLRNEWFRQTQRDYPRGRRKVCTLEVGKAYELGAAHIKIVREVMRRPKIPLLVFVFEFRNWFELFVLHNSSLINIHVAES